MAWLRAHAAEVVCLVVHAAVAYLAGVALPDHAAAVEGDSRREEAPFEGPCAGRDGFHVSL